MSASAPPKAECAASRSVTINKKIDERRALVVDRAERGGGRVRDVGAVVCGRLGWLRSDTGCQRITRERIEEYLAATATVS